MGQRSSHHIEKLAADRELISVAKGITHGNDLYKDLLQDTFILLHQMSDEEFFAIKKLREFCIKVMLKQYNLPRSSFYYSYRHTDITEAIETCTEIPQFDEQEAIEAVTEQELNFCNSAFNVTCPESIKVSRVLYELQQEDHEQKKFPFRTELFKVWAAAGSTRKVERDIGINYRTVAHNIKGIKQEILRRTA